MLSTLDQGEVCNTLVKLPNKLENQRYVSLKVNRLNNMKLTIFTKDKSFTSVKQGTIVQFDLGFSKREIHVIAVPTGPNAQIDYDMHADETEQVFDEMKDLYTWTKRNLQRGGSGGPGLYYGLFIGLPCCCCCCVVIIVIIIVVVVLKKKNAPGTRVAPPPPQNISVGHGATPQNVAVGQPVQQQVQQQP